MHSFEVHSNESACRKKVRLGMEQVIRVASSASIPVLVARDIFELTNLRSFLLTSATATMSNSPPTSLFNYKSILKENMNLVGSKLNGLSIMSPPAFTVNTSNKSTVSSLQSQVPQEGYIASNSIGKK